MQKPTSDHWTPLQVAIGERVWWASASQYGSLIVEAGARIPRAVPLLRRDELGLYSGAIKFDVWSTWRARFVSGWIAAGDEVDPLNARLETLKGMAIAAVEVRGELNDLVVRFEGDHGSTAELQVFCDHVNDSSPFGTNWEFHVGSRVWSVERGGVCEVRTTSSR